MDLSNITRNKYLCYALLLITFFAYFYDLGNLDGLRQGTEGFYLKITDEMFKAGNILEPLYNGKNHWSKPPLQFWLPRPLFFIFGEANIYLSRLSIALFTLLMSIYFIRLIKEIFNIEYFTTFFFLTSSLTFFKYGRIFMMEAPLALLTAASFITFFQYLQEKKKTSFWLGSLLAGMSVLVKGPVSLVMIFGSIFIYLLIFYRRHQKLLWKEYFLMLFTSIAFASPWFLISLYNHGYSFFEYFFLRENMGKFSTGSFPMRSVIQGFFLYSLPWSLYIPSIFSDFKQDIKNEKFLYLFIGTSFFLLLWLIPSQRSHHYAVPSIPLFLTLALSKLSEFKNISNSKASSNLHLAFMVLLIIIILLFLYLVQTLSIAHISSFGILATVLSLIVASVFIYKRSSLVLIAQFHLLSIAMLWLVVIPSVAYPKMPAVVIDLIGNKELSVVVTKPYFVEQALGREVTIVHPDRVKSHVLATNRLYLVHQSTVERFSLNQDTDTLHKWTIWRRGIRLKHILHALRTKSDEKLKDYLVLLKKK